MDDKTDSFSAFKLTSSLIQVSDGVEDALSLSKSYKVVKIIDRCILLKKSASNMELVEMYGKNQE